MEGVIGEAPLFVPLTRPKAWKRRGDLDTRKGLDSRATARVTVRPDI